MNLHDALNYRRTCLICNEPMQIHCYPDHFWYELIPEGLKIFRAKDVGVLLRYDGAAERLSKKGLHNKIKGITPELIIGLACQQHDAGHVRFKSRSLGITTMGNLKQIACNYDIAIFPNGKDSFSAGIKAETIKYNDGGNFFHANSSQSYQDIYQDYNSQTELLHGNFNDSLDQMFKINIPHLDLSQFRDLDHFLNKFRLLMTFS